MRRNRHSLGLVAACIAAALTLAGAAVAAVVGRSATATTTIKVTETEFHLALSPSSIKAGTVTFVVHNAGKVAHSFDIAGAGLTKTVQLGTIAPGATRKTTVKLSGGKLSLWCAKPGHAALGMKVSLKVATTSTSTSGSGATTTPTSTTGGSSSWG